MLQTALPRTGTLVSSLGIAGVGSAGSDRRRWKSTAELARRSGVNLFDLTSLELRDEAYYRDYLAAHRDPCSIIVRRSIGRLAEINPGLAGARVSEQTAAIEAALAASLTAAQGGRDGPLSIFVEWEVADDASALDREALLALDHLARGDHRVGAWGARVAEHGAPSAAAGLEPYFQMRSFSLLDRPPRGIAGREGPPLITRDPFAGGRLDGSRFDASVDPLAVTRGPIPLSQLQEDFAPVRRLSPLTRPGERTLPQAALRYLRDVVGAFAVVIDPPDPRRLKEILGFEDSPALDQRDLELIDHLPIAYGPSRPSPFSALRPS